MDNQKQIRNFSIIAHIDHGKSTLADRFLEITYTVEPNKMHEQFLDRLESERKRGITIKLQPVRMIYDLPYNLVKKYNFNYAILNLIDTPGHVDFTYEVSRSLAACEGAILVVDATQGIEAQTISNTYLAIKQNLSIIPVVNKIDLPNADPDKIVSELNNTLKINPRDVIFISAKLGTNVDKLLEALIEKVPSPSGNLNNSFKALIFDSFYDFYKGVIIYVRVFDGSIQTGDKIKFFSNNLETEILELGYFNPDLIKTDKLLAGEIGYIATGLKDIQKCRVGDTVFKSIEQSKNLKPLPGYKKIKPIVFADIYPLDSDKYLNLKNALEKLKLNDFSLEFSLVKNSILTNGFRIGCLGLLHLEIIKERLETEYGLKIIVTSPSVAYKIIKKNGEELIINNPSLWPSPEEIKTIYEPWTEIKIITLNNYLNNIMELLKSRRGVYKKIEYLDEKRLIITYKLPLLELIGNLANKPLFYDQLKSVSSGYASLSYKLIDFEKSDLVKLDIIIAGEKNEIFSQIVHKDEVYIVGRYLVKKLKEYLPKQLFTVSLQAAVGSKIIAREDIPALKKDVTAKLYGGDFTRKAKLLEKQKKGKKKMKKLGKIEIPSSIVFKLIKR